MSPLVEMLPLLNRIWKFRFLIRLKRVLFDLGCTAICRSGRPRGTPLHSGEGGKGRAHGGRCGVRGEGMTGEGWVTSPWGQCG